MAAKYIPRLSGTCFAFCQWNGARTPDCKGDKNRKTCRKYLLQPDTPILNKLLVCHFLSAQPFFYGLIQLLHPFSFSVMDGGRGGDGCCAANSGRAISEVYKRNRADKIFPGLFIIFLLHKHTVYSENPFLSLACQVPAERVFRHTLGKKSLKLKTCKPL